jgi:hypothetical protein
MTIDPNELPPAKPKPTIAEIVMDLAKTPVTEADMSATLVPAVRAHYPDMPPEQLDAAIRAEVAAWNAQTAEPGFWDDVDAARALDPDWHENPNRSFGPSPGALYDTPQKLVAAYRAWQDATLPVEELVEVIMQRAIPARAKPGDAEVIAGTMMQMVKAHPRRDELLEYGVEQAWRAGLRGKAKRG